MVNINFDNLTAIIDSYKRTLQTIILMKFINGKL